MADKPVFFHIAVKANSNFVPTIPAFRPENTAVGVKNLTSSFPSSKNKQEMLVHSNGYVWISASYSTNFLI
jgi:hypothetical protein